MADAPQPGQRPDPPTSYNNPLGYSSPSNVQGYGTQYSPIVGQQLSHREIHRSTPGGFRGNNARHRPQPNDRPKSKHAIPGCEPWLLVNTKLGRRFVYNPDQDESFWKFPPDVMKAVVEYDRLERERKTRDERKSVDDNMSGPPPKLVEAQTLVITGPQPLNGGIQRDQPGEESDEYEEVDVTDEDDDEETAAKRQKTEENETDQPVEFNEEDIAFQLAAMGQDYGLDPGEYGELEGQELEEGAQGLPLSEEDASALFKDMLDDHRVNPYKPWEKLIEAGHIIEDDRYTVLPNTKTRKEIWAEWSRDRVQTLKEQREKEEKKDARIPYLAFLQAKATPKLYWPEFRRKYMKEPEMRDTKLSDKEREKWYRDYINRE